MLFHLQSGGIVLSILKATKCHQYESGTKVADVKILADFHESINHENH